MDNSKNYYALHAVIFKKKDGWDYDKAEKEVNNYIKSNKKHFYRETKSSYRFRNIPKQKFISKTFRTKNLKNGISLIMGELKPESRHLEGAGIFDLFKKPIKAVKDFFSPRQGYNNTTTKNLNQFGNIPIKRLTIVRTPIMGILDKALNLISFGKWSQLKKEYGHDKLFHLALIANLGAKNLVIEKNEVINVNTSFKMGNESETLDVDLKGKTFTVNEMLDATRKTMGDSNFFSYNGMSNNCQTFIKNCLMSVGLYDSEENTFVFQDLSELSKKFPSISKKIMNATTKLGAIANKLTGQGEGDGEKEVKPIEEFKNIHVTKLEDFTLKQLRQIAKAYNEYVLIEKVSTMNKADLIAELEKHLDIVDGELQLRHHNFEIVKKNKKGSEVTGATNPNIIYNKQETDKIEKRMLLLRNKHNKIVSQILADHMSKFYTNLQDVYNEIESETNNKKKTALQTKYKKKFKLKTNEELNKFLIENSPLTQEQNNEELQEIHKEYNELQEKMREPENVKQRLEAEKIDVEIRDLRKKQREIENNYEEEINKKLGENIVELAQHLNYLRFTGINYDDENKTSKKELMELQKRLKKKFKIRTNDELYDFISNNLPSKKYSNDEEYEQLNKKMDEVYKNAKENKFSQFYKYGLSGHGKMSLKDEFKMDEKDHEKKLDDFESSNPSNEKIKETLAGLKSITESGLAHIKNLEEMLSLNGGSAKSAGFIRAIMARRKAKKEGKELTRDAEFKNYEKSGFKEQKLNRSSKYLVNNMFDDGIYKKLVLNFAVLNENYLYNTKGIREIYEKDPEKAKKAIGEVDGVLGDEKKIMAGIKKQIPNYDDLTDVEKTVYMINYKQAVRASILGKYFEGIKPIEVDKTEELKERMKQNYIRWYNKNKKSKKGKKETKQYDELLEKIEGLDEGDELEIPIPTKGKKETVIELEDQIKENKKEKRKKTDEKTPSEDRKAVDDALMEFMKRTKKEAPKKKQEDDFEDLLAQSGLTLDDLNF